MIATKLGVTGCVCSCALGDSRLPRELFDQLRGSLNLKPPDPNHTSKTLVGLQRVYRVYVGVQVLYRDKGKVENTLIFCMPMAHGFKRSRIEGFAFSGNQLARTLQESHGHHTVFFGAVESTKHHHALLLLSETLSCSINTCGTVESNPKP